MIISRIIVHQPAGLLRILTDAGVEGRCTGVAVPVAETDIAAAASILINTNPVNRERLWLAFNEADGSVPADLRAGIDVALWDLVAKVAGRPVHRHVNGFRNRIPVCRRSERNSAEEIVQEAQEAQSAGFRAYKFAALLDEESVIDLIHDVRRVVGPDFCLLLDGRTRWVLDQAIRIGRALDAADFFCFDRPRPDNDISGGRQLAAAIDTPTSTGVSSPMEAAQVMTTQAADHISTGGSAGRWHDGCAQGRPLRRSLRDALPSGRFRDLRRLRPSASRRHHPQYALLGSIRGNRPLRRLSRIRYRYATGTSRFPLCRDWAWRSTWMLSTNTPRN